MSGQCSGVGLKAKVTLVRPQLKKGIFWPISLARVTLIDWNCDLMTRFHCRLVKLLWFISPNVCANTKLLRGIDCKRAACLSPMFGFVLGRNTKTSYGCLHSSQLAIFQHAWQSCLMQILHRSLQLLYVTRHNQWLHSCPKCFANHWTRWKISIHTVRDYRKISLVVFLLHCQLSMTKVAKHCRRTKSFVFFQFVPLPLQFSWLMLKLNSRMYNNPALSGVSQEQCKTGESKEFDDRMLQESPLKWHRVGCACVVAAREAVGCFVCIP